MSLGHGSKIVRNGLVLHLDAANKKSYPGTGTVWKDLSGNGINGTLVNSVVFQTTPNRAFEFDGTDDYITISYSANNFINTDYTWNLWVIGKHSTAAGITHNMPDFGYGSGSWARLGFRETGGAWSWMMYNGSGPTNNIGLSISPSYDDCWLNLTVVADFANTQIRSYVNGAFSSSVDRFTDTTGNSGNLGLGRAGNTFAGWNEAFLGKTSNFTVYNRSLTPAEINQNFEAVRGRYGI
jgi:hypothetical protein